MQIEKFCRLAGRIGRAEKSGRNEKIEIDYE